MQSLPLDIFARRQMSETSRVRSKKRSRIKLIVIDGENEMDMEARFREMAQEEVKAELAALREKNAELAAALEPFVEWLNHLEAIGSRRLENDEAADIFGGPRMGILRRTRALLAKVRP